MGLIMGIREELNMLAQDAGIVFMEPQKGYLDPALSRNFAMAMDAQPALVTASNSGVPAWLSNYFDPKLIEVLVSPMKATEILGEVKKGDWVTDTTTFMMVESTGQVSSYGDYSNNGSAGANVNFPTRQSYHYQVVTQWGEQELERAALAKIDYASRVNIASVLTLNKFQNKSYFYGIYGLKNYGLLNDPSLPASITADDVWAATTTDGGKIYESIRKLFLQLQTQTNGLIETTEAMTLAMSPTAEVALNKTNTYNVNVHDQLKKNFPNMKIVTAPEYSTDAGELVQLIVDNYEGQQTAECAFTEKMRAHPVKIELSSFTQKKTQGTWGTIIYRPFFIASMIAS